MRQCAASRLNSTRAHSNNDINRGVYAPKGDIMTCVVRLYNKWDNTCYPAARSQTLSILGGAAGQLDWDRENWDNFWKCESILCCFIALIYNLIMNVGHDCEYFVRSGKLTPALSCSIWIHLGVCLSQWILNTPEYYHVTSPVLAQWVVCKGHCHVSSHVELDSELCVLTRGLAHSSQLHIVT